MELKKHNEILDELEKLLDSNLGNVNPLEYQKLQDEYAALLSERTELEAQLVTQKEQTELLVDKVVETESERDNYKKKIDELSTGVEGFTARIEELLKRIAELETEVERRDAVVIKMAEKYQLVEKDEFGEDLIAEATEKTKK
jgi:peptidoglycan hydrolase CwlO-like protein